MLDRLLIGNSSGESHWMTAIATATSTDNIADVAVDSSGNVYLAAYVNTDACVFKLNPQGIIQWQRKFGDADQELANGLTLGSDGSIYVCGYETVSSVQYGILLKYDSSGSLQWQRRLSSATVFYDVALDSSGNPHVCGSSSTFALPLIMKYDSSGNLTWQRSMNLNTGTSTEVFNALSLDSSGNVYTVGGVVSGSTTAFITKHNSSGTLQWQRYLGTSGFEDCITTAAGNTYVCKAMGGPSGLAEHLVAKYDTSGTLLWQKFLGGTVAQTCRGVALDSSENVYVIGYSGSGTGANYVIFKVDSSGNLQWQRTLRTSAADIPYAIKVDNAGNFYAVGYITGVARRLFVAKLPGDGSKTGTYTVDGISITYEASTYTFSNGTATNTTGGATAGTPALTSSTTTTTEAALSQTQTVTYL